VTIRTLAHILTWSTAAFCIVRGLPVLIEGWKYLARSTSAGPRETRMAREAHEWRAFFDVDGTLIEKPSLECRFFRRLRHEGKISATNCIAWLREAVRLAPNGLTNVLQGNKAYLRGIRATGLRAYRSRERCAFFS